MLNALKKVNVTDFRFGKHVPTDSPDMPTYKFFEKVVARVR